MMDTFSQEVQVLCERLLKVTEEEQRALDVDDVDSLEACIRRKQEIVGDFKDSIGRRTEAGLPQLDDAAGRLLEQVIERHVAVRDGVKRMLLDCQEAILGIGTGRRAHRAYQKAGKKGSRSTAGQSTRNRQTGDACLAKA